MSHSTHHSGEIIEKISERRVAHHLHPQFQALEASEKGRVTKRN